MCVTVVEFIRHAGHAGHPVTVGLDAVDTVYSQWSVVAVESFESFVAVVFTLVTVVSVVEPIEQQKRTVGWFVRLIGIAHAAERRSGHAAEFRVRWRHAAGLEQWQFRQEHRIAQIGFDRIRQGSE